LKKVLVKNKILFGLILILLATGCGLKGNPEPYASTVPIKKTEQNLSVAANGNAVALTWRLQNPDGKISYMNVEKSELGSAGNVCKDCPRNFEQISQLPVVNVKTEKNEYQFSDANVSRGKVYSYRLKMCEENGVCHESQTVEIDYQ